MRGDWMKDYWKNRITKSDGTKETMKEYSERIKPKEVTKNDGLSA